MIEFRRILPFDYLTIWQYQRQDHLYRIFPRNHLLVKKLPYMVVTIHRVLCELNVLFFLFQVNTFLRHGMIKW